MSETFAQRVERLKKNDGHKILADMPSADQECIRRVGSQNLDRLGGTQTSIHWFRHCFPPATADIFGSGIYRIRPDYQPEPEYVDLPIVKVDGWLGAQHPFTHLHCLPSLPGFRGFWLDEITVCGPVEVPFGNVARKVDEGRKVVARFRKE